MPDLPVPGAESYQSVGPGPDPQLAGAGWAVAAHGFEQAAQAFGGVDQMLQAHQDAVDAAQVAKQRSGIETDMQGLAQQHPFDPQGFLSAATAARSDLISRVPARYAMAAGSYWDLQKEAQFRTLSAVSMAKQQDLAISGLRARLPAVDAKVGSTYAVGAPLAVAASAPDVIAGRQESDGILDALVAAKAISIPERDQARAQRDALWSAQAYSGHLLSLLHQNGSEAALAELARMQASSVPGGQPSEWEKDVKIDGPTRAMMIEKGRSTLDQALQTLRAARQDASLQSQANAHAMDLRMQAEVDHQLHYGEPSDAGPTDAEVISTFGADKVAEFARRKSEALKQHGEDGITPAMSSDDIAQLAARKAALKPLDIDLGTPERLSAMKLAIRGQGGGISPDGTPRESEQHALGSSQLLVSTARAVAARHGLTDVAAMSDAQLHAALMSRDQALNTRIGDWHLEDLAQKYGDPRLVSLAYHNGEGQADKAVSVLGLPDAQMPYEQWLAQVRAGVPGKLTAMPKGAQYVEDVAARMQTAQRITAAQATVARANEITTAAVSDPVGFGQEHGWGQPSPLTLDGFGGPPRQQAQFGQALQARLAQAGARAQQHAGTPPRLLSAAEASYYRDRIGADPALGPKLAAAAAASLGGPGAAAMLHEIGQTDSNISVGLQLAALQTMGGPGARMASAAVGGIADRQADKKPTPLPKGTSWDKAQAAMAPAFENVPGATGAVRQIAELAHLHDSQAGHADVPDAYMRSATGGFRGRDGQGNVVNFGGVDVVNDRPTLLPPWMLNGQMPRALQIAGDAQGAGAPVYSNGAPLRGKDIARMQPVVFADGRYGLINPGTHKYLAARDGSTFKLDLGAAKPLLTRAGGIVAAAERAPR